MKSCSDNLGRAIRPMPGETLCGDQVGCWRQGETLYMALADGLGHGPEAHHAALSTMQHLMALGSLPPTRLLGRCDTLLRGTRGVALAMALIDDQGTLTHVAVGNIRALLLQQDRLTRLGGARGIVGAGFHRLYAERHLLRPGDWLVMFSDGISEDIPISDALKDASPTDQTARTLLQRWARDNDDAAILLYRHA
ncbi:SpoIIE family protein phosphatase [Ectothiorhodospira shaposhnikovii]|uniref:SpoIIE family protein phosphatase n=1 Tax=Ectothiorhodospira shaposhnikovii TaxID=1054 RepID=UPI001EE9644B|nr:SpoIIE family protein phosphatase [Ectothiorhodospira shaposhnikovii]MCG5511874.1 SpoIIE family protein phosphatase [Ectothiorhodospira shaposhnikovii]